MKKTTKSNLKSIFSQFNKTFFKNSIRNIDFKLNNKIKQTCFWNKKELQIGSNFFCEKDFFISFLHELIHIHNFQKKIIDVGTNSYHNKSFLEKALDKGFFTIKHKTQGWSILSLNCPRNVLFKGFCSFPNFENNKNLILFIENLDFDFQDLKSNFAFKTQQKKYTYKYTCRCPMHNSIRSGRDPFGNNPLEAKCLRCNSKFEFANKN